MNNKYKGKRCVACNTEFRYTSNGACVQCSREARKHDKQQEETTTMLMIDRYNFERVVADQLKEVWE
jgi:uncharacterized Zn ribbon protein